MENYQREKLGLVEYESVLIDNISTMVVNRNYISQNSLFWDNMVFKLFEQYYFSREEISIRKQAESIEIFLGCLFEFKPSNEKPQDVIEI